MEIRANVDICLCCLFQCLVFSERREMLVTDRRNDRQTARLQNAVDDQLDVAAIYQHASEIAVVLA